MKGISPFIATVLLIAFTIVIAGVVNFWLTSFTKTTTEVISEETSTQIICQYGGILLKSLAYNNPYLTGTTENTGSILLGNLNLEILYLNLTRENIHLCLIGSTAKSCTTSNITLSARESIQFNVSIGSNYDKIKIITNCTSIYDMAERNEVG